MVIALEIIMFINYIETTKILCGQLNAHAVYNLPTFRLDTLVILRAKVKRGAKMMTIL